jgi:hypothetical protein
MARLERRGRVLERRPALVVTRDDDGGVTVSDRENSGLVVSVVAAHPASSLRTMHVEVYPYESGKRAHAVPVPAAGGHVNFVVIAADREEEGHGAQAGD